MILRDFHVHTCFCDGKNTPEKMVKSAIDKGFSQIGILTHSYVPFDGCCIPLERIPEFQGEIARLKRKYAGRIDIFCGLEADIYSPQTFDGFDYIIGSVHYLKQGERYISVDDTPGTLRAMIDEFYGGDFYACASDYFETVSKWAAIRPDIVGHFDIIKKFSSEIPFDERCPSYINAWKSAADKLISCGIPFEVNTGGIQRGWCREPYPSLNIAEYIKSHGGKLILSSDAHSQENIGYKFDEYSFLTV